VIKMNKLTFGFFAGVCAGIIKNGLDLWVYYGIGFQHHRYLDHASGILLGRPADNLLQALFFLFIDLWFTGLMGLLFTLLIPHLQNKHYLFRGWLFGTTLWFAIHSFGSVLRIPTFNQMLLATLILHFVTDSIYGVALAFLVERHNKQSTA